ncbi:protein unc-13 homolog 4B isoform X2 [Anthonomus grandis grandis]|uniref:protein unc-13 homolog 4B isoform X2 n=1 Tax=Anthonomus grandis grandis TaxID=2921223 RepID=UPI002166B988|nr:protein unc-13 homolog 4B isoform X2 [Anthonomus grandis grandis]
MGDMETEEMMWKQIYTKLNSQKSINNEDKTEHEIRIQEVDNGFFEKFGSLFRDTAEMAQNREQVEKEQVAEAAAQIAPKEEDEEEEPETPPQSASESEATSSDYGSSSELDKEYDADFIAAAFNIDELYSEILYVILHNVGCDVNFEVGQTALFSYAQEAFKISSPKHRELLELAEKKDDPELLINVEVIKAKELRPKDSNGSSDPFVTLYLASNTSHRYNTSVKTMTLNPVWEEHFALPIVDNNINDTLCLEVWDFDAAETVKEKFGKILDVKGVKGMRKLIKEIAVTATTGQHENEFIGSAKIPLSTIPASGMTMWYTLDKKNKTTRQGVLKVRICFSSGKNNQVAMQEHRHMRRIVLLHELELSKVAPYWWCGNFSPAGEQLLTQHVAQSGLTQTQVALCSYSVYAGVHQSHPLSFNLFSKLLDKLMKPLQTEVIPEDDMKLFWEATKKLLPSCFSVIKKIRKKTVNEKNVMKQVLEVLKILNYISSLEPRDIDLFPRILYPWIKFQDEGPYWDIQQVLKDAVSKGADDWLTYIIENNKDTGGTALSKLQNLLQMIQLIRSDLQKAIEFYDKLFIEHMNFQYAKCLYNFFQAQISGICEPDVRIICKNLKTLNYSGYNFGNGPTNSDPTVDPLAEGTSLFELYLAIQRFVKLGEGICPLDFNGFYIKNFHKWFHEGVAQWLDIAVYKALQRIEKAVELDQLVPIDSSVKYSSSAVDTLTIFYQVNTFWQQLNWPDVESCYSFIAKIIDDICRCCIFYAQKMSQKVDGMGVVENVYETRFEVTNEWCLAINNIDYVRETLEPFTNDLGMEKVLKQILELKSPIDAQRCRDTLKIVISNAVDTVRNEIVELLQTVVEKMTPSMKRLLIEGAELFDQDSNSIDRLMLYVDQNLATLNSQLNEENFNRTLELIWEMLSKILNEIIQNSIENRRPPSFFANLKKTLKTMVGAYSAPSDCDNCDALMRTEKILTIHGLETADLIHEVNLELADKYDELRESPYGEISFRCKFQGDSLIIEVINARDLASMDSGGTSDSFVRIHLLPEHKFNGVEKPKTKTHNKTLFPLYDETFTINLTPEQRELENGLILFSIKDKDMLGYNNQYIGEAYIRFKDIPSTDDPLSELPQVKKLLGRPKSLDTDAIKGLETRQGDKQAKEFLKKFKQKVSA